MQSIRALRLTLMACTALVASAPGLRAQTSFGVLLGGNASRLSGVDLADGDLFGGSSSLKDRIGFQAGFYIRKPLNKTWSIQPELHYTQKGTTFENNESGSPATSLGFNFGYAEVPVLLRADLGAGRLHPFIVFGPSFSMRLACDATLKSSSAALTVDCDQFNDSNNNPSDPFKKTDFGGSAGIGLAGRGFGREVSAQVRYGRSFTNVLTSDVDTSQKPKNSVISVVFGLGR